MKMSVAENAALNFALTDLHKHISPGYKGHVEYWNDCNEVTLQLMKIDAKNPPSRMGDHDHIWWACFGSAGGEYTGKGRIGLTIMTKNRKHWRNYIFDNEGEVFLDQEFK